ncbi:hypothetical protein EBESD8_16750 [Rhodococcus aetherivorans]|nr:hypothetical protein EBESD8_16750 [Rhodococcus aetherivorans]
MTLVVTHQYAQTRCDHCHKGALTVTSSSRNRRWAPKTAVAECHITSIGSKRCDIRPQRKRGTATRGRSGPPSGTP